MASSNSDMSLFNFMLPFRFSARAPDTCRRLLQHAAFGELRSPGPGIALCGGFVHVVTLQQQGGCVPGGKVLAAERLPKIERLIVERQDTGHVGTAAARHDNHMLPRHLAHFEFFAYLHLSNV